MTEQKATQSFPEPSFTGVGTANQSRLPGEHSKPILYTHSISSLFTLDMLLLQEERSRARACFTSYSTIQRIKPTTPKHTVVQQ